MKIKNHYPLKVSIKPYKEEPHWIEYKYSKTAIIPPVIPRDLQSPIIAHYSVDANGKITQIAQSDLSAWVPMTPYGKDFFRKEYIGEWETREATDQDLKDFNITWGSNEHR